MRTARHKSARRGATFVVWLLVIAVVFFGVIASLLTGESAQYGRAVEEARSRETLYLAEGGLARALARARTGELTAPGEFKYEHGRGRVTVTIENAEDGAGMNITAMAVIQLAQREWEETVTARIAGSGPAARLEAFHWVQNYD